MQAVETDLRRIVKNLREVVVSYDPFDRRSFIALKTSLSLVIAAIIILVVDFSNPYLGALGVVIATFPFQKHHAFQHMLTRVAGSFCGCLAGFIILGFLIQQHFLFSIFLFLVVAFGMYLKNASKISEFAYPSTLCFIVVTYSSVMRGQDALQVATSCAFGFAVGATSSYLINIVFFPEDDTRAIIDAKHLVMERLGALINDIYTPYLNDHSPSTITRELRDSWLKAVELYEQSLTTARESSGRPPSVESDLDTSLVQLRRTIDDIMHVWGVHQDTSSRYHFQENHKAEFSELLDIIQEGLTSLKNQGTLPPDLSARFQKTWRYYEGHHQDLSRQKRHLDYSIVDVLLCSEAARSLAALFRDIGGKIETHASCGTNPISKALDLGENDSLIIETFPDQVLTLNIPAVETAIKAALGVFINFWLFFILDLPGAEAPTFSLTVVSIYQADAIATFHKGLLRLTGCFAGIAASLVFLGFQPSSTVVFFLIILIYVYFTSYIANSGALIGYFGTQASISFLNVIMNQGPVTSIDRSIERPFCIGMGVSVAWLISYVLFPKDIREDIGEKIKSAWRQFAELFNQFKRLATTGTGSSLSITLDPKPFELMVNAVKSQREHWLFSSNAADAWLFQARLLAKELTSLFALSPLVMNLIEQIRPGFWQNSLQAATDSAQALASGDQAGALTSNTRLVDEIDALLAETRATGKLIPHPFNIKQEFSHAIVTLIHFRKRFSNMAHFEAQLEKETDRTY